VLKDTANTPTTQSHESSAVPSRDNSVKGEGKTKATMTMRYAEGMVNEDPDRTLRGIDAIMADQNSDGTGSDQSQPRNEDVFLNIARVNSERQTAAERAERRTVGSEIFLYIPPNGSSSSLYFILVSRPVDVVLLTHSLLVEDFGN
jgi:hypothetical protein